MSQKSRIFMKRLFYSLFSFIFVAVVLLILFAIKFFTGDFIGRESGPESITIQPDSLNLTSETVQFPARDGITIEGWLLPADPPGKAVIILSHGGGSNRSRMLGRAASLINGGFDVLAIDLRAHGGSEGNLNSLGMMEALDILGAVDFLKNRGDNRPIILMGLSLGSVSSINAAAQFPNAAAVIAEGAFITSKEVIIVSADLYLSDPNISFLERVRYEIADWPFVDFLTRLEIWFHSGVYLNPKKANAIESVKKIQNTPILFLAGENEFLIPERNAKVMLKASRSPQSELKIIKGGGHSIFNEETKEAYNEAVFSFLEKVLK